MRSPNWHENEIMLALDLYLSRDLQWINRISDSTFEIIALSQILNALDFYDEKPDNFRSTGSIRMKLANFMALDERYKKNSLDNVGSLDKSTWQKYAQNRNDLHTACINILCNHLITHTEDIDKYIQMMGLDKTIRIKQNFTSFVKQMRRALAYYSKLAEENQNVSHSNDVIEWCKIVDESSKWIDEINEEIDFTVNVYKEHAGINMVPVKGKKVKKISSSDTDDIEKIGKFVRRTFNNLIVQDKLSEEMIENLTEGKYSKDTFGLKFPFLRVVDKTKNLREQLVDENGYVRYWTSPFEIYGIDYCVNKEWYENQRFRYLRWLSLVDIKPFYMIKKEKFQAVLNFIKKLDSQKVSFTKMEILAEFSEEVEMEEVISILIQKGVLVGFQGSTKEFVIDDYDMLFRMLNNPQDYARE